MNDNNAYVYAMEKLVTYYPKKEYWVDLLSRLQRKPNFSDRLALDAYRLSLATGSMTAASDYMEMAQLALQAELAAEGKQVLDKGFAPRRARHGRAGRARQAAARPGRPSGWPRTAASRPQDEDAGAGGQGRQRPGQRRHEPGLRGQAAKGLQLMQQGIAKGGLKRPEDAKLHLGIAQLVAGDNGQGAGDLQDGLRATTAPADLARLWALYARRANGLTASQRGRVQAAAQLAARSRIAPSRRITSPLSISLVTIWCTSLA